MHGQQNTKQSQYLEVGADSQHRVENHKSPILIIDIFLNGASCSVNTLVAFPLGHFPGGRLCSSCSAEVKNTWSCASTPPHTFTESTRMTLPLDLCYTELITIDLRPSFFWDVD